MTITGSDQRIARVIARAWNEPEFKQSLKSNPRTALSAMGIELPADMKIEVLEDSPLKAYFVLPSAPHTQSITDADLEPLGNPTLTVCFKSTSACCIDPGVVEQAGAFNVA